MKRVKKCGDPCYGTYDYIEKGEQITFKDNNTFKINANINSVCHMAQMQGILHWRNGQCTI